MWPVSALLVVVTLITGAAPLWVKNQVAQSALFSIASAFLSVLIGLIVVNIFLNSKDRKRAAFPLLTLVGELIQQQHNDLFITKGRDTFGMDKFNSMLDIYSSNKRNPQVFSPDDLETLYNMVISIKDQLIKTYVPLEAACRDIAYILGWTYDPRILAAILQSRAEMLSFIKNSDMPQPASLEDKRSLVAQYLDIDGATGFWVNRLSRKLGLNIVAE